MKPEYILLEFDAIVILSQHCFICFERRVSVDLMLAEVDKKDRDLIPFEHIAVPCCISCRKIFDSLDMTYILERLDYALTTLEHEVLSSGK